MSVARGSSRTQVRTWQSPLERRSDCVAQRAARLPRPSAHQADGPTALRYLHHVWPPRPRRWSSWSGFATVHAPQNFVLVIVVNIVYSVRAGPDAARSSLAYLEAAQLAEFDCTAGSNPAAPTFYSSGRCSQKTSTKCGSPPLRVA